MKEELNRTIFVLESLTNKIINIKQKSDTLLTQLQFTQLEERLFVLSGMLTSESGGSIQSTILFTVSNCSYDVANGGYWLINDAVGIQRIFTNGTAYCIGQAQMYDPNVPAAGYQTLQWLICENSDINNIGQLYANTIYGEIAVDTDPWNANFIDDMYGTSVDVVQN